MLRMVLEDYESSYEDLLSKCGVSMLQIQRARTLAIEVYKSIHQMTPIYIQEMFNIKITPYDLRDHVITVPHGSATENSILLSVLPRLNKIFNQSIRYLCRTVMPNAKRTTHGLKSFTYEGSRIWNSLPIHIKVAGSLGIFKDSISKWQPKFLNRF